MERLGRNLAIWKLRYLSLGGHLTLINSALSNLPSYFLSFFECLVEVVAKIEKLQRDFSWQGSEVKHKFNLVAWEQVYKPLGEVGLGSRPINLMNQNFLGTWFWRLGDGQNGLWKTILSSKYDATWNGWDVPACYHYSGI